MKKLIEKMSYGLTPQQAATVAFVGAFVTVLGAIALVYYFRRSNKGN